MTLTTVQEIYGSSSTLLRVQDGSVATAIHAGLKAAAELCSKDPRQGRLLEEVNLLHGYAATWNNNKHRPWTDNVRTLILQGANQIQEGKSSEETLGKIKALMAAVLPPWLS